MRRLSQSLHPRGEPRPSEQDRHHPSGDGDVTRGRPGGRPAVGRHHGDGGGLRAGGDGAVGGGGIQGQGEDAPVGAGRPPTVLSRGGQVAGGGQRAAVKVAWEEVLVT